MKQVDIVEVLKENVARFKRKVRLLARPESNLNLMTLLHRKRR